MAKNMRSQIEYNNALLRVGQDIYEGIDLVDACKKECIDPNSFVGKLVLAGMTLEDISKEGKRFPIHFKRRFRRSEQDEAVRQHLEGVPWSLIASRLGAYESSLSHWLRWMGYGDDPKDTITTIDLFTVDEDDDPEEMTEKPEIAFDGDLTTFRNMVNGQVANYLHTYFTRIGEEGVNALLFSNVDDDKCPRCKGDMRIIVTRDGHSFAGCLDYHSKGCGGSAATEVYKKGRLKRAILDFEETEALANETPVINSLLQAK